MIHTAGPREGPDEAVPGDHRVRGREEHGAGRRHRVPDRHRGRDHHPDHHHVGGDRRHERPIVAPDRGEDARAERADGQRRPRPPTPGRRRGPARRSRSPRCSRGARRGTPRGPRRTGRAAASAARRPRARTRARRRTTLGGRRHRSRGRARPPRRPGRPSSSACRRTRRAASAGDGSSRAREIQSPSAKPPAATNAPIATGFMIRHRARLGAWLSTTSQSPPRTSTATHRFYTEAMGFDLVKVEAQPTAGGMGPASLLRHRQRRDARRSGTSTTTCSQEYSTEISTGLGLPPWANHIAFDVARRRRPRHARSKRWLDNGLDAVRIDHGWCMSIYADDPSGITVEFCMSTREFTDDDRAQANALRAASTPELNQDRARDRVLHRDRERRRSHSWTSHRAPGPTS